MDKPSIPEKFQSGFERHILFLGVSVAIGLIFIAGHNMMVPENPPEVGFVELDTQCNGIDVGVCIGIRTQTHETYNYDNYTEIEEGTEDYYRLVESELMAQAYNICDQNTSGKEWTSEASFDNVSGDEWEKNDNVTLLDCEQTFWRELND